MTLPNGKRYEGEWLVNSRTMQGWGASINSSGTVLYEGWFLNSKAHGKGRTITRALSMKVSGSKVRLLAMVNASMETNQYMLADGSTVKDRARAVTSSQME